MIIVFFILYFTESFDASSLTPVDSAPADNEIVAECQTVANLTESHELDSPDTQTHESIQHKHRRIAYEESTMAPAPLFHDLGLISASTSGVESIYELGNMGTLLQSFVREVGERWDG